MAVPFICKSATESALQYFERDTEGRSYSDVGENDAPLQIRGGVVRWRSSEERRKRDDRMPLEEGSVGHSGGREKEGTVSSANRGMDWSG